jgi:hypothetical protein
MFPKISSKYVLDNSMPRLTLRWISVYDIRFVPGTEYLSRL